MFSHLPLLPIQLKTRPYHMKHTNGDAQFINGPKPTQAEILDCFKSIRDQLDEVYESAAKNISYVQAKQGKNYDACHIRKLLSVGTKVMIKDKAGEVRKGDKLKVTILRSLHYLWGPSQRQLCSQGQTWEEAGQQVLCKSPEGIHRAWPHLQDWCTVDMLPVHLIADESCDEEMEAPSKGPDGKMPDLPVPATPPKSLSNMSHVTSIQVPKSPSQLSAMNKSSTTSSVQVVGVHEGLKFQFLPLDDDQHTWLCRMCTDEKQQCPAYSMTMYGSSWKVHHCTSSE